MRPIATRHRWLNLTAKAFKLLLIGIAAHSYATPAITLDAGDLVAISGTPAGLQFSAADSVPFSYQWYLSDTGIPNATNASLNFTSIQTTNAGRYRVVATDSFGSITSRVATVTVENYPNPATIVAWGDNSFGQTNLPAGETNIVALAAGQAQTVFLRRDGTLGDFGAAIASPGTYGLLPHVAAISTIGFYGLALETNGTPVSFGLTFYSGASDVAAYVTNAVQTAIGYPRLALLDNGTVTGWNPNPDYFYPPDPDHILSYVTNLSNVVAIAVSNSHCLALYTNHTVIAFGIGQPGDSAVVPSLTNIVAISGGASFSLALKMNGTVVAWGDNTYGETNVPAGLSNVMAIATGDNHSLVLESNGTVVAWGDNTYGQTNVPAGLSNVVFITGGSSHSAVLTKNPGISIPPKSLSLFSGGVATFTLMATGYAPLNYQWEFNGTNITGATNSTLLFTNIPLASAGTYQCIVTNAFGSAVSPPAVLTVNRTIPRFDTSSSGLLFSNGGFVLNLNPLSGHGPVIIFASTNLSNWTPIYTNPAILGSFQVFDFATTNFPFRFYRALEQ